MKELLEEILILIVVLSIVFFVIFFLSIIWIIYLPITAVKRFLIWIKNTTF